MKILIVVPPDRKDFYSFLQADVQNEYVLLWYNRREDLRQAVGQLPDFFSDVVYWRDYRSPGQLLRTVKPDRIVFYEIIDQQQIGLIVRAKAAGITTFYLEHGAAGDAATALERSLQKDAFSLKRIASLFKKLYRSFLSVVRTKYFYYLGISGIQSLKSGWKFFKLPILQMLYGPNKALRQSLFRERVPDYNIVFNRANFEQFQLYTGITKEDAIFSGVPMFDVFYDAGAIEEPYVVYIEQPFLEVDFMSWTNLHHKAIAMALFDFATTAKMKLFVKLHPLSDKTLWDAYGLNSPYFEVVQEGNFVELYLRSKLILGYASSLITGLLCAKKNIVLLGWHPAKKLTGNDFSQTGLCHVSLEAAEINSKFDYWIANNKAMQSKKQYEAYLHHYNLPFDGKATQRIIASFTLSKYGHEPNQGTK